MVISEKTFKENLIYDLNLINAGWIDGDKESNRKKTVDIVNHSLKIAIEIKDDTKYKIELPTTFGVMIGQGYDLTKMNQRFGDHIRSANNKFKEYPGYKTILLFRTEFIITDVIRYAIEGLHSYSKQADRLVYIGRKGKYSKHNKEKIGCFIVVNQEGFGYFSNDLAEENRFLDKGKIERIFGRKFNDIQAT